MAALASGTPERAIGKVLAACDSDVDWLLRSLDSSGPTALHIAAARREERAAEVLINLWPEATNIPDREGHVPAHVASLHSHHMLAEKLLAEARGCTSLLGICWW